MTLFKTLCRTRKSKDNINKCKNLKQKINFFTKNADTLNVLS